MSETVKPCTLYWVVNVSLCAQTPQTPCTFTEVYCRKVKLVCFKLAYFYYYSFLFLDYLYEQHHW